MTRLRNIITFTLFASIAVFALYGCDDNPPPNATPTPASLPPNATPTPASLPPSGGDPATLAKAAHTAMAGLKSFHFTVEGTKDGSTNLTIVGDVESPDKAHSTYQQPGAEKGELVVFGKDTYLKPPGVPLFVGSPGGNDPPLAVGSLLFPTGLTYYALLADSASLVADEKIDGADTTHMTFTFSPAKAKSLAAMQENKPTPDPQESEMGSYTGDMWVEKGTNYVRKLQWIPPIVVSSTPEAGWKRTVLITYSKFNEPVSPPLQVPAGAVTKTPTPSPVPEEP